jgi:predicted AAA+ superfamily ATPase
MPLPRLDRHVAHLAQELLGGLRVLILNGPRQAGKTTLMRELASITGGDLRNLDEENMLRAALTDPGGFVRSRHRPVMIDEVQRAGDPLVLAVKAQVDRSNERGQFVLAGSTRFLTEPTLTESLAGRAAIVEVWPFSQGELEQRPERFIDLAFDEPAALIDLDPPDLSREDYLTRVTCGGFPEAVMVESERARSAWFDGYVAAVTERDVREMARIREPSAAVTILGALAAMTAQELQTQMLSSRTDFSRATVDRYLSLLESVFMVHRLPPWSRNALNRAVRRPKLHMIDTGLASHLVGVSAEQLARPGCREVGPLVETFVVNELAKQATWAERDVRLFHYRQRNGGEADLILEDRRGRIVAVDVKSSMGVHEQDFRHFERLSDLLGDDFVQGLVVYLGERVLSFGSRMTAVPLGCLWRH